jgi:hypothetical protein
LAIDRVSSSAVSLSQFLAKNQNTGTNARHEDVGDLPRDKNFDRNS